MGKHGKRNTALVAGALLTIGLIAAIFTPVGVDA